jgi:branched-chain amino acid transport system permease protein
VVQFVQTFVQQLIIGVQLGSVYALIAVGYTMVYGVLQFINFAHGDVYMVGAYMGLFVVTGFSERAVDSQAMVVVLSMVLIVALLVSMRGHWRDPKAIAVRFVSFGVVFALLGVIVRVFLTIGTKVFGVITGVASHSVVLGGLLGLLVSVTWCGLLGLLIERTAYKPIRGAGRLTALITAIGISLLIENGGQAVFGAHNQAYSIGTLPGGAALISAPLNVKLGPLSLSLNRGEMIVLVLATVLVSGLIYIIRYTRMGKAMRAVAFDRDAAALMGINTDTVIAFTFFLGAALAGAGGFLNYGLTQFSFDTQTGIMFGLKAFVAAVLGGIGNLGGAVLGGIIMGIAETFVGISPFGTYKEAIAFIILIAILLFRPAGLLGRYTVEKV